MCYLGLTRLEIPREILCISKLQSRNVETGEVQYYVDYAWIIVTLKINRSVISFVGA